MPVVLWWLLVTSCGSPPQPSLHDASPSCPATAAATQACGVARESCCLSLAIPAGSVYRTYSNLGAGPKEEADPAAVSAFRLDKYLVTVGRFRQFVAATAEGWSPDAATGKHAHLNGGRGLYDSATDQFEPGWQPEHRAWLSSTVEQWGEDLACDPAFATWTDAVGANELLPVNCVDWYDATAFCIWDGGFLPSEAEWADAAAGGQESRAFPWGAGEDGGGGDSRYLIAGCNYPPGATACTGIGNIAPVGTAPLGAGRWKQVDLAGELAEWTVDWFTPFHNPCRDCVALTDFSYRVLRGGSFGTNTEETQAFARDGDVPASRNAFHGFRCARAPL